MLKIKKMDLAVEFQKLKEGQEQILEMLIKSRNEKKEFKVYSLDELAQFFGVTKRTIYNWKDDGRLPFVCLGSKTYVTSTQLEEFLIQNEVKPLMNRRF